MSPCQFMPPQETLQHYQVVLVQSPVRSLLLSSGSWCGQDFVCGFQGWSLCFPQSCASPIIKACWPSRSDSLGIPSPIFGSLGWEGWCGIQNLHNSRRISLVLLFSSLWLTHLVGLKFWFYGDCVPPIISLRLLCLWTWGIFFWWVPAPFCQWLFNS